MKIYQFWGMRRSGNHAIIEWFLNNLSNNAPLEQLGSWDIRKYGDVLFLNNYEKFKTDYFEVIKKVSPKILVVSYEDKPLTYSMELEGNTTNIVIYRSLENVVASRYQKGQDEYWKNIMPLGDEFFAIWKKHARYETKIFYDKWLIDLNYRNQICNNLGIPNLDITDTPSRHGEGSSFIGIALDKKENLLSRANMVDLPKELKRKIEKTIFEDMPINTFCINLQNTLIRYNDVAYQFHSIGIKPKRFIAPGQSFGKQIERKSATQKQANILTALLILIKNLSVLNDDFFLILEDDCQLLDQKYLQTIIKQAPDDWDVIFLGGMNHEVYSPIKINEVFYKCVFSMNHHALLIKKSFIPKLVKELETMHSESDVIMAHMQIDKIGNWYGLMEDLVIQNGRYAYTTITAHGKNFEKIQNLNLPKVDLKRIELR